MKRAFSRLLPWLKLQLLSPMANMQLSQTQDSFTKDDYYCLIQISLCKHEHFILTPKNWVYIYKGMLKSSQPVPLPKIWPIRKHQNVFWNPFLDIQLSILYTCLNFEAESLCSVFRTSSLIEQGIHTRFCSSGIYWETEFIKIHRASGIVLFVRTILLLSSMI